MKTICRSYKFELRPNQKQKVFLDKHFGCTRFVYNYFLNRRKNQYQTNKEPDNYYNQAKFLTELKRQDNTIWLKEVNSQSLQFSLRCLDTAYINFFRGNAKFPRFKSKKKKNSFTIPQHSKLFNNKIYIPKLKDGIKIIVHRNIKGKIEKCTFSKTPTNKYFVSILTKEQYKPKNKTGIVIGCDLGLKNLLTISNGTKFKNHKYIKKYETKLSRAQRHLSRKQSGSNSFEKQRRKIAKIHEKVHDMRIDNLHKITNKLITCYDIICVEDLNVKKMITNHKLAKHIAGASWSTFIKLLKYKADWNDKQIIKINRFYPSSKTCHYCGWINKELNLSTRKWICENCNSVLDRDINASINILNEGLKTIGAGLSDNTGGAGIRPNF